MKILYLLPYIPVPPIFGGALRIYHLLKSLASEHEVTVLCYGTPEKLKLFRSSFKDLVGEIHTVPFPWSMNLRRLAQCYSVFSSRSFNFRCYRNRKMQQKAEELLNARDFDVIHSEFPYMGQFASGGDATRILDMHNVEYYNFRRMWLKTRHPLKKWFYHKEYRKMYREEVEVLHRQDAIFTTSKEDLEIIRRDVAHVPAWVIPNGVDTSFFTPAGPAAEPHSMVFTGMMGYTPNHDGMLWFLEEIFPLILRQIPDARVYIVGSRPPGALRRRRTPGPRAERRRKRRADQEDLRRTQPLRGCKAQVDCPQQRLSSIEPSGRATRKRGVIP